MQASKPPPPPASRPMPPPPPVRVGPMPAAAPLPPWYKPPQYTELPSEVKIAAHPHPLFVSNQNQYTSAAGYTCDACGKAGAGYAYHCLPCEYDVHPECALPKKPEEAKAGESKAESKMTQDEAATKVQALYRAQSMRKLSLQDKDKAKVRDYLKNLSGRQKQLRELLQTKVSRMAVPVVDLIWGYAEEHVATVKTTGRFPFQVLLEGKYEITCGEAPLLSPWEHMQLRGDKARREVGKMLGKDSVCVRLFWEGKSGKGGQEIKDDELVVEGIRRPMPVCGRPYVSAAGADAVVAPLASLKPVVAEHKRPAQQEASPVATADWSASLPGQVGSPSLDGLTKTQRRQLSELWAHDAQSEHASIASFARVTLQLMAAGAPAGLLADTQRAAADEVRHARICFALAAAYSGAPVEPGKFPIASSMELETDLPSIAAGTASEGCVEETLSCLAMAEACARCEDPCVRTALTSIVKDEARHAALAWRTVQWALQTGGKPVAEAVAAAFLRAAAKPQEQAAKEDEAELALEPMGRLSSAREQALRGRALKAAVAPMAAALLAGKSLTAALEQSSGDLAEFTATQRFAELIAAAVDKH